jgi:cytochrome c-type biogenesis protein CcmH
VTLLALALLAIVVLAPLAIALSGRQAARSRQDSALAIHRAQLAELDRDFADGRIGTSEHAAAKLEVQRRLLAAADAAEPPPARASRLPVYAALVAVPVVAASLYAVAGHPFLPAAPLAARPPDAPASAQDTAALATLLRARLATLDPHSDQARQGYLLLGNTEFGLGHLPEAVDAWRRALAVRFDPSLAALVAEAQTRLDGGRVSFQSATLFRRALAEGPADAPWRPIAEKRLAQSGG